MKLKKLNLTAMSEGVVVEIDNETSVTLRSTGSKQYQDYVQTKLKPYKNAIKNKTLSDEALGKIYEKVTDDALAEIVVLGWTGIQDEEGNDIPWSVSKARELFTDEAYAEFKALVSGLAAENETFRQAAVDAVVKN